MGITRERKGRDKSRNVYKRPMGMGNGVGIDCVEKGRGQGRPMRKKWDNCN